MADQAPAAQSGTIAYDPNSVVDKSVFELLGLNGLSNEKKDAMMQEMLSIVDNRVLARIADQLDSAKLRDFEAVMEGPEEGINAFLESNGLNMQALYAQETMFYKFELLEMVGGAPADQSSVPTLAQAQ